MAGRSVAVTGADTFFGRALVTALETDPAVSRVLAIDTSDAGVTAVGKVSRRRFDLVHPASVEQLADALVHCDVVVHTAFLSRPQFRGGWAHELETTGTRHLLMAVEAANVGAFVLRSTTLAYGARPLHPARIKESAPLEGAHAGAFLRDKVEAETQVQRFAERHPDRAVTVLRFAPMLAAGADTISTAYLAAPVCPVLLGFDPIAQFIHVEDAVEATRLAVHANLHGAVNVGAPGVLSLRDTIRLAGARALPLPEAAVRRALAALWSLEIGPMPPGLVDFLRYPLVGDLAAMRDRLHFTPKFDVRDTVLAFAGARRLARLTPRAH